MSDNNTMSTTAADSAEDLRLPQTVVGRIINQSLPPGVIVSKVV